MQPLLTYRGRQIWPSDVEFIKNLIKENPNSSRRALSKDLCRAWNWVQSNGQLRDMVCRSMMLALHRAGHIELPPVRRKTHNPLAKRKKPPVIEMDTRPIVGKLKDIGVLELRQVRRTKDEWLFNSIIETHHYLGYTQPVGEHLKHLVYAQGRPVACFAWSSAPRHLGPRDRFIGWSKNERKQNIRFLAYNSRFLILPWVRIPHLASHLLGRLAREISGHWEKLYDHPIHLLETFVDPGRFRGTCYRAANWKYVGQTTGRGKDDLTHKANRPIKDIYVYPLKKRFRELLRTEI